MNRRLPLAALVAVLAACCAPAHAASTLTITGAGFGHGVGMSQYGALGYAEHGWRYDAILRHYYTGTALGRVSPSRVIRVLLETGGPQRFSGASAANGRALSPGRTYTVSAAGGALRLRDASGRSLGTFGAPLVVTGPGPLRLYGTTTAGVTSGRYRGWLELRTSGAGVMAVNALGIEQYVAGVVGGEVSYDWPLAALEAQAVAARTYAITTKAGRFFDQYAGVSSQMYMGVSGEAASINRAVNGTRGRVVTYRGRPVATFFFSTSGGRTENVEDSFLGSPPEPWLKSVNDPYDSVSPEHRWRPIHLSMAAAAARLGGLVKGRFRGIRVLRRGHSPRIVYAQVLGTGGATRVTGPDLRERFGLMDTWAYFTVIRTHASASRARTAAKAASEAAGVLSGDVVPGRPGDVVLVQRRTGRSWSTEATARLGRGGAYRVGLVQPGAYRVVAGGAAGPVVRVG